MLAVILGLTGMFGGSPAVLAGETARESVVEETMIREETDEAGKETEEARVMPAENTEPATDIGKSPAAAEKTEDPEGKPTAAESSGEPEGNTTAAESTGESEEKPAATENAGEAAGKPSAAGASGETAEVPAVQPREESSGGAAEETAGKDKAETTASASEVAASTITKGSGVMIARVRAMASSKEIDAKLKTGTWYSYDDYGLGDGSGDGATPVFTVTFEYNGEKYSCTGQCIQPSYSAASGEVDGKLKTVKASNLLAKVLYYGNSKYAGDACYYAAENVYNSGSAKDKVRQFLITHLAAGKAYGKDDDWDNSTNATAKKYAKALVSYAEDMPAIPDPDIFLNKDHAWKAGTPVISSDGKYQVTETFQFTGAAGNYVEFPAQAGVQFMDAGTKKEIPAKSGKVKITAGMSFYLQAPVSQASTAKTYSSGKLIGQEYTRNFEVFILKVSGKQDVGFLDTAKAENNWVSLDVSWLQEASLQLSKITAGGGTFAAMVKDNPMYSLAGAEYGVYDTEAKAKAAGTPLYTLTTGADGKSQLLKLPADAIGKTWYVREKKAARGYQLDTSVHAVALKAGTNAVTVSDVPLFARISIAKYDAGNPEGGYEIRDSLTAEGIVFGLYYYAAAAAEGRFVRSWNIRTMAQESSGKKVYAAALDAAHKVSGSAFYMDAAGNAIVPLGTLQVKEENPGEDFTTEAMYWEVGDQVVSGDTFAAKIAEKTEANGTKTVQLQVEGKTWDQALLRVKAYDYASFGDLSIEKRSALNRRLLAGASFRLLDAEGNTFVPTEKNRTRGDISADGTIITGENGRAELVHVPVGEYTLQEIKAPVGYKTGPLGEGISVKVQSRKDLPLTNEPKRGELLFRKVQAETKKKMANIPFRITHTETGESHIIMTDENGTFDSRRIPHSEKTNAGDENGGDASAGVWFGLDENGKQAPASDESGAFPYGDYVLEELRCEGNAGRVLITETFHIRSDAEERNGGVLDLGTLENEKWPEIHTKASGESGSGYVLPEEKAVIVDEVSYERLTIGTAYRLQGTLMHKDSGEPVTDPESGEAVTSELTFTPEGSRNGSVTMQFSLNALSLAGEDVVVFEELTYADSGEAVADHKDLSDEGQTISFVKISTQAVDPKTKTNVTQARENVRIVDTVTYENLKPGKRYTLSGILMDRSTGETFKDAAGKEVRGETVFTAREASGTAEVEFVFDGRGLTNQTFVVFEELSFDQTVIARHEDPDDEAQTVYIPDIGTTLSEAGTGSKYPSSLREVVLEDVVSYKNLMPGTAYTVKGTLMDKSTGETLTDAEGKKIEAKTTFTPEEADGSTTVTFRFTPAPTMAGKTAVAFEEIPEVAVHADLKDEGQTVYFPGIGTQAADAVTKKHLGKRTEVIALDDTVQYTNLKPGTEYRLQGVLMDRQSGKPLTNEKNEEITAEMTFMPESAAGSVQLSFSFPGSALKSEGVVVFESLYLQDECIAEHKELSDEGQTVYYPQIRTQAKDAKTGKKTAVAGKKVKITDTVTYQGLIPGQKYLMKGRLMNKKSGEILKDSAGKEVTAKKRFQAEKSSGTVELTFTLDASGLGDVTTVAFEKLLIAEGEAEIAAHEDLTDEAQTVKIRKEETPEKETPEKETEKKNPKTGDAADPARWIMTGAAALAVLIFLLMHLKKKGRIRQ